MFRTWRVVGSIEVLHATFESSFPSAFDDNTIIEKIGLMLVRGRMDLQCSHAFL